MAVNATAIWRVRPSGSNANGGGYDPGISGAGTDYSQQNAAQASGTNGVTTGTTTFVDSTANAFTSAMVGNAIYITGSGQTTGWYFVTAYTSSSTVTLDRSPGTGTGATWYLGGGWANSSLVNLTSTGPLVPGNTVYLLGGSSPSYTSPDITISSAITVVSGSDTSGYITIAGDPNTPSGNGYSGYPLIKGAAARSLASSAYAKIMNLWIIAGTAATTSNPIINIPSGMAQSCVFDQNGYNACMCVTFGVYFNEFYASSGTQSSTYYAAVTCSAAKFNNIHDTLGPGLTVSGNGAVADYNIIAKCGGLGLSFGNSNGAGSCCSNIIDGNKNGGLEITGQYTLATAIIVSNIISDHASSYALYIGAGTEAENNLVRGLCDYNTFWDNNQDTNLIGYGAHDTSNSGTAPNYISSSPFVNAATQNYTLV